MFIILTGIILLIKFFKEPNLADGRHREKEWNRDVDKTEKRRDMSTRDWDKGKEEHRRRHSRSRSRERERKNSRRSYTPAGNSLAFCVYIFIKERKKEVNIFVCFQITTGKS